MAVSQRKPWWPSSTKKYDTGKYLGDSSVKQQARFFVYQAAKEAPLNGHAITLTGPMPMGEVSLMRDYLKRDASKTWFIDWAREAQMRDQVLVGLQAVKDEWPEANVLRADVDAVMKSDRIDRISFVYLDHMTGLSKHNVQRTIQTALSKLMVGGVMALTWIRAREQPHSDVWKVTADLSDKADLKTRRWIGLQRIVGGLCDEAGVKLETLKQLEYHHRHSAMAVAIWKRV